METQIRQGYETNTVAERETEMTKLELNKMMFGVLEVFVPLVSSARPATVYVN